jgi:hypothetical protein
MTPNEVQAALKPYVQQAAADIARRKPELPMDEVMTQAKRVVLLAGTTVIARELFARGGDPVAVIGEAARMVDAAVFGD